MKGIRPEPWMDSAVCAQTDPEVFFPEPGGTAATARRICSVCPVQAECLAYALQHQEVGIWGGTNARTRQRMRREEQACA